MRAGASRVSNVLGPGAAAVKLEKVGDLLVARAIRVIERGVALSSQERRQGR